MKTIQLRNVSTELSKALKQAALDQEKSMNSYILDALHKAVWGSVYVVNEKSVKKEVSK